MKMNLTASPTGSITDKAFYILEAATTLVVTANKMSAKIHKRSSTVALAKHEAERVAKQLREAAIMIDNLLAIIEGREIVNSAEKCRTQDTLVPASRRRSIRGRKKRARFEGR